MKAETLTLTMTVTIRPSYGSAAIVRQEIEQALDGLADSHNAITIAWSDGSVGEGEWPDPEEAE